jgi:dihydrofolate synthase/folylpolyglutamate synthase
MRFAQALGELDARQPEHMPEPDLERITELVDYLDQPQLTYPTIHVTGTNGKTTTARIAADLACAHGLQAGLFTSPHLASVTERFRVCDSQMTAEEFGEEWERLRPYLELADAAGHGAVTYFEAVTALAFLWFSDKPVGVGVFEVGMGGRWDATNVVAGDVAVICEIGLDHPELGATVAEVASEKAGIIKPAKPVVVREQPPEAMAVIEARAAEAEATVLAEHRDWAMEGRLGAMGGQALRVRGVHAMYEDLFLPLYGVYAAQNAAAGLVAVEVLLGHNLDDNDTREALGAVRVQGRLEVVGRAPTILLDGAHNPAGAEALVDALQESFRWARLHLVLAVSANKDIGGIVAALAVAADSAHVTRNDSVRSAEPSVVADLVGARGVPVEVHGSVADALDAARTAAEPDDLVLVTGSLYTVADARRALGSV